MIEQTSSGLYKPKKVEKVYCKCGELLVKIYPWSPYILKDQNYPCLRCQNKRIKTERKNKVVTKTERFKLPF